MPSSFLGLFAGWLAWWLTRNSTGVLGDVLTEVYAVLAFGIVSALVLMLTADLRLAPAAPPVNQVPSAAHSPTPSHH
jgi:hypothetical protein